MFYFIFCVCKEEEMFARRLKRQAIQTAWHENRSDKDFRSDLDRGIGLAGSGKHGARMLAFGKIQYPLPRNLNGNAFLYFDTASTITGTSDDFLHRQILTISLPDRE